MLTSFLIGTAFGAGLTCALIAYTCLIAGKRADAFWQEDARIADAQVQGEQVHFTGGRS